MTRPVSDCCAASLDVDERTVAAYFFCRECNEPCDPAEPPA